MERFMAGETTNAEEKALIGFSNGPSAPADMERYRYMMMFYDRGLQLPAESSPQKNAHCSVPGNGYQLPRR